MCEKLLLIPLTNTSVPFVVGRRISQIGGQCGGLEGWVLASFLKLISGKILCLTQVGLAQVGLEQAGSEQVGLAQVGPGQRGLGQYGAEQVGSAQVDRAQPGPAQVGNRQKGLPQVGSVQVGPAQVGPAQVGPGKIGTTQSCTRLVINGPQVYISQISTLCLHEIHIPLVIEDRNLSLNVTTEAHAGQVLAARCND